MEMIRWVWLDVGEEMEMVRVRVFAKGKEMKVMDARDKEDESVDGCSGSRH